MLIWLLHYREGIEYGSDNPLKVLNVSFYFIHFLYVSMYTCEQIKKKKKLYTWTFDLKMYVYMHEIIKSFTY